ncbi:MAG: hypothetical protein ACFE7E_05345 [Candidatus Hodarchaeota archaeon]
MAQNTMEEINKKLEEVVEGRRYIIRQVGSLKSTIDELAEKIGLSAGGNVASSPDLGGMMPILEDITGQLRKISETEIVPESVKDVGAAFEKLESSMQDIKEGIQVVKDLFPIISDIKTALAESSGGQIDTKEIKKLTESLEDVKDATKKLEKISRLEERIQGIEEAVKSLASLPRGEGLEVPSDLVSKIAGLEEKLEGFDLSSLKSSTEELENMGEVISTLRESFDRVSSAIESLAVLREEVASMKEDLTTVTQNVLNLQTSIDRLASAEAAPAPRLEEPLAVRTLDYPTALAECTRKLEEDATVGEIAKAIDNVRKQLEEINRFHPALFEMGTFHRRLSKRPPKESIGPDLKKELLDTIKEWESIST